MKISELIEALGEIQGREGDIEVLISGMNSRFTRHISRISSSVVSEKLDNGEIIQYTAAEIE